jgi:PST family polysaccharide transporter
MRATALLSASSLITIAAGLVSSKFRAELIGPSGVALAALLTAAVALISIPASLGIGPAVVRELASADNAGDLVKAASVRRVAWRMRVLVIASAVVAMVLARAPLSRVFLSGTQNVGSFVTVVVALGLLMVADLQASILNGYHKVSALARISAITAVSSSAVSICLVVVLGLQGVAAGILASAAIVVGISCIYLRREAPRPPKVAKAASLRREMRSLLRFGLPYTLSSMVGTGSVAVLPILVLHELGAREVAFYQAAFVIAISYLGFLITAMGIDYFPRVSACRREPAQLATLIQEQLTLVLVITLPLIIATCAIAPQLISAAFTSAFRPAVTTLDWQLFADLFKFVSWTMAFVILARRGSSLYLLIESLGGAMLLLSTFFGTRVFGLAGVGVGFLATYIVYAVIVWVIVRRDIGLRISARNARHFAAGVLAVGMMQVVAALGSDVLRLALGAVLTGAAVFYSLYAVQAETGMGWKQIIRNRRVTRRSPPPAAAIQVEDVEVINSPRERL